MVPRSQKVSTSPSHPPPTYSLASLPVLPLPPQRRCQTAETRSEHSRILTGSGGHRLHTDHIKYHPLRPRVASRHFVVLSICSFVTVRHSTLTWIKCQPFGPFICPSVHSFIGIVSSFIRPSSVRPYVWLFVRPHFVLPSFRPSVRPSVCPSVALPYTHSFRTSSDRIACRVDTSVTSWDTTTSPIFCKQERIF